MESSDISENEVKVCLEIKQFVKGELRYGKKFEFKDKTIMVIYVKRENKDRIVTVYPIRRKKWQN